MTLHVETPPGRCICPSCQRDEVDERFAATVVFSEDRYRGCEHGWSVKTKTSLGTREVCMVCGKNL